MNGPRYKYFKKIADLCMTEFCNGCNAKACEAGEYPDMDECPFRWDWQSIYDDLDQLVARAGSEKKVKPHDA